MHKSDSGRCRLCGKHAKFVESHIIPEAFFRDMSPDGTAMIFSAEPGVMPKRAPTGIYDTDMLCASCDNGLGKLDQYGIEYSRRPLDEMPVVHRKDQYRVHRSADVDCGRLKLFLLSVLWRAHWSRQPFYSAVDIGPAELGIKRLLLRNDPGGASLFPVCMLRYWGGPGPIVDAPSATTINKSRVWFFHFAHHDIYFFADTCRPRREWVQWARLTPDQPLVLVAAPLMDGPKTNRVYRTAELLQAAEKTWPRMPKQLQRYREEHLDT